MVFTAYLLSATLPVAAGLGLSFDIDALTAPGATGAYNSDFASKASTICRAVTQDGYEFGLVHVKAVDDTGHDRLVSMKVWLSKHNERGSAWSWLHGPLC